MAERRVVNGETVERVESFGKLNDGHLIYVFCCCSRKHRGLIFGPINLGPGKLTDRISGEVTNFDNWMAYELVPGPSNEQNYMVSHIDVERGCVWRVVTGAESKKDANKKNEIRPPAEVFSVTLTLKG